MSDHDQDFKYVLDNLTKINIGARYSYEEIIENQYISYKFRQICHQCFEREVAPETTIESHLYYLAPSSQSFLAYQKLKTNVTLLVPDHEKKQEDGTPVYHQHVLKVSELTSLSPEQKKQMGMIIQEIEISKLGLSMYVL